MLRHRLTTRILLAASDQVLVAHQLRRRRRDFGSEAGTGHGQLVPAGLVVEDPVAEFTDRPAAERFEGLPVMPVEDQPAHFIDIRIDQGMIDDLLQGELGEHPLGRDALAFRRCGQPGELVAGFLLVGHGEDLAEIGKCKPLVADDGRQVHTRFLK